jgi:hypothetical protein
MNNSLRFVEALALRVLRSCWRSAITIATIGIATLAAAPAFSAQEAEKEGSDLGPGCAPNRPAIPHHAGGVTVHAKNGEKAPVPCSTRTGFRTGEVSLVVNNSGSIVFQPALASETTGFPVGVLRSTDRGEHWNFITEGPSIAPRSQGDDLNFWLDRQTGRIFWTTTLQPPYANDPPRVDHSDDEGRTWTASSPLPVFYDHTQVFGGPPTERLKGLMNGYPNVVYTCVSGGATCGVHGFCGTHCTKSLDGAMTFGASVALPYPPECPAPGVFPTGGYGLAGVVDPDGTVYVPFTPCERPYVAVSRDEGSTWQLNLVADTETIGWGELALGMDEKGNLYAAWAGFADRLPYLAISRDGALHWSKPVMIAAPGVNEAAEPQLVAGARGQVAVTYYGSKNAPQPFPTPCTGLSVACAGYEHETWDTYITETWNALEESPLLWSATLNDPAHPTWFGVTPSAMRLDDTGYEGGSMADMKGGGPSVGGRMDYYGMTMGPDGTPWVGFAQECPRGLPVPGNPICPSTLNGSLPDGLFGMVGRLVRIPD